MPSPGQTACSATLVGGSSSERGSRYLEWRRAFASGPSMSRDGNSGSGSGSSGASSRPASTCSRLYEMTSNAAFGVSSLAAAPEGETLQDHLLDVPVTREQLNHYRKVAESARSELAASLVKFECVQSELLDLRSKMFSKEVSCQELKAEMESYKENNARQSSLLISLRDRVQETEKESVALATSKMRTEITVHAVTQENQDLKKKITDLEAKLKKYSKENEESKNQAAKNSRKLEELLIHLSGCLEMDMKNEEESQEHLISKVRELHKENILKKEQIVTLEETINVHEMEAKASRQTIMRLVSEVNKEQKKTASCIEEKEMLNKDLISAVETKQSFEREMKILQERLAVGQRAWDATKKELSHLKKSFFETEKSLKNSMEEAKTSQSLFCSFVEQIADLLSRNSMMVKPTKEDVLDRIQEMSKQEAKRKQMVSQLEAQIAKLTEQLENETGLHQKALQRAQKAEKHFENLQGQLTHLEGELVSGDVLLDSLSLEKQKYLKFVDQLSEKMKLDEMTAELGFDMRLEAVLARAEQLVRLESNAVIENKTMAHSLQRKLKAQKERLESRELHMNLLRQKIIQLEEERQVRTALAVEKDEANLTIRKLQKMVERLQKEIKVARESNTELKAKLSDTNELKIKTLEQTKTIENLNKSRGKLEKMKEKVEKQLISIKSELDITEHEAKEDKERAKTMLDVVTSEMKTLKTTLEETTKREKQLVDFREVVSRMMGLNITSLAVPDYEIIKCLERLIHSHQHHFVPCACLKDMTIGQDRSPQDHIKLLH
ncbi:coiled-coil domain-containing protein 170 isoform X1 [Monodelphis domestica]|uniref:Coiled-coil domain containing 170 n=1 Tax=Monodelphis domestica TaxID=13616 RepID=F6RVT1_MONDO|nr:coiled-coil domain-containing protein 170 isoform X1 [Monodelphis domestica]